MYHSTRSFFNHNHVLQGIYYKNFFISFYTNVLGAKSFLIGRAGVHYNQVMLSIHTCNHDNIKVLSAQLVIYN